MGFEDAQEKIDGKTGAGQDGPNKFQSEAFQKSPTSFADRLVDKFVSLDRNQSGFISKEELNKSTGASTELSSLVRETKAHYSDLTRISMDRWLGEEPGVGISDLANLDWCSKHGTGFGSSLVMGLGNMGMRHLALSTVTTGIALALFARNASLGRMLAIGLPTGLATAELASTVEWRSQCKPSMDRVLADLG